MVMTMAFNYGGRAEIVDAVRAIVAEGVPPTKSMRRRSGATSTSPTCPTPTWSSGPRGRPGSRISCSGRWPTASWCSPRPCGPTCAEVTSTRRSRLPAPGPPLRRRQPLTRPLPEPQPWPGRPTSTGPARSGHGAGDVLHPDCRGRRDPPAHPLRGRRPPGRPARLADALVVALTIAVLIAAGSLLYGRDSHGAKAVERKRPAQEAPDRAAALAADARRATAQAAKRGERYCPLDPAHRPPARPHAPCGEPLSRQGRRLAHLPPGRGRPHRRLPHRAPRQGAGRRQGRAQDHVEIRRPAGAADPRGPPALAGAERPRHREPGRGARCLPCRARGPRAPAERHGPARGDRPDGPGAPPRPPALLHVGRRPRAPWPTTTPTPRWWHPPSSSRRSSSKAPARCSRRVPPAANPTARWNWSPSTSSSGGTLCRAHRSGRPMSPSALVLLRRILGGDLAAVLSGPPPPGADEVAELATEAMEVHLDRRIRSVRSTATL